MLELELTDYRFKYIDDILLVKVDLSRATINEALEFRNLINDEINGRRIKVIVDLSQCEFIDSTFIGALVVTYKKLLALNGRIVFVQPSELSLSVLTLVGALKFFRFFKTTSDALLHLKSRY